jgi:hypothetical protein
MTNDLEDKLDSILYEFDSHNPDVYSAKQQIRQAFIDAGWEHTGKDRYVGYYTGQEWYDRFEREYHMRADWIAGDPDMGDDAEHDVLLAAKLASGIE